jgi:hypothetical protein
MSAPVCLTVTFRCDENDPLAEVARDYAPRFGDDHDSMPDGKREARYFLDDISGRTGPNPGRNGGLCVWGTIGNFTPPEVFVEALMPFFLRLWIAGVIPLDEHVLILSQRKGGEATHFCLRVNAEALEQRRAPNLTDVLVATEVSALGWYDR